MRLQRFTIKNQVKSSVPPRTDFRQSLARLIDPAHAAAPSPLDAASYHSLDREEALVARMAADLRRLDAFGSEAEAVRALSACPYRMQDIVRFAGQALFAARLETVGHIMARH